MLDVKEYDILLRRFRHLLKSETIREFDEWDAEKGQYKRNISELDNEINFLKKELIALKLENSELKEKIKKQHDVNLIVIEGNKNLLEKIFRII